MARIARVVFANTPHYVTQWGTRQKSVFFDDADKCFYLNLLQRYSEEHQIEVLAYCLMNNQLHLILRPSTEDGLQKALKPLHMRYTQHINKKNDWTGILWQGRFFSCPLDENYTFQAIRYVEDRPVHILKCKWPKAIDYGFSSAKWRASMAPDNIISPNAKQYSYEDYLDVFSGTQDKDIIETINSHVKKGLPCGSVSFVNKLSNIVGRDLSEKTIGRPKGTSK